MIKVELTVSKTEPNSHRSDNMKAENSPILAVSPLFRWDSDISQAYSHASAEALLNSEPIHFYP